MDPGFVDQWGFHAHETPWFMAPLSLFVHANTLHLLGNMIFLAAVGAAAEIATGSIRFFTVYMASGLIGILVYSIGTRGQLTPPVLVGASGCIAGCAAYYSIRYVGLRVPIAPKFGLPVAIVTATWFVLQLLGIFIHLGGDVSSTAFLAHGGGFVAGLALSVIFKAPDLAEQTLGHAVLDQMNNKGPDATIEMALRHLSRHPGDKKAHKLLADAYHELGQSKEELEYLLKLTTDSTQLELKEIATRVAEKHLRSEVALIRRLQIFESLSPEDQPNCVDLIGDAPLLPIGTPLRPDALLVLGSVYRENQPDLSKAMLERLQVEYPVHSVTDLARKRGLL